jgi:hypothetical protein
LRSGHSARACQEEFGFGGTNLPRSPSGCHAGFSAPDARASPLVGKNGNRWNLLNASFNLLLFVFSFISVTQTPKTAILFQLI